MAFDVNGYADLIRGMPIANIGACPSSRPRRRSRLDPSQASNDSNVETEWALRGGRRVSFLCGSKPYRPADGRQRFEREPSDLFVAT